VQTVTYDTKPVRQHSEEDKIEKILRQSYDNEQKNSFLNTALNHHFQSGGSRTRAKLTYKFSRSFLVSEQNSQYLACVPELLHNASLIHDDLQDLDEERRNDMSLWKKYGSDVAICAGDFLISAAYGCLAKLETNNTAQLLDTVHKHVSHVIRGQVADLEQDKDQSLDEVGVYEMIGQQKSGPLLAMCLTLPLIMTGRSMFVRDANEAFEHFAIGYQIYDDINDIEQDQSKEGVKPGVNIVTIMQKNRHESSVFEASQLGLSHLNKAKDIAQRFPFPSNVILEKEIDKMITKIEMIGKH